MTNKTQLTLDGFLAKAAIDNSLAQLIAAIANASIAIAALTENGALDNTDGSNVYGKLDSQNVQGETQAKLDVVSNAIFIEKLTATGLVAGMVSEENGLPITVKGNHGKDKYIVAFDPLDGSSNIDVNVSVGSIFSVFKTPHQNALVDADYLMAGSQQIAAGYAAYGPCTMLIISLGKGTHGFTLNRSSKQFLLTHANMQVPKDATEYAINTSNQRFWQPPVQRYVTECEAGAAGRRKKNFNMRWIGSMVADIHRILIRGGIYLYPKDSKNLSMPGRLRLMYEANPMAMLVEQAGGLASTGKMRILDIKPEQVHLRVPVIIGAKNEVELLERYHL